MSTRKPEHPDAAPPDADHAKRTMGPVVVGIGASAGGLAALRAFFARVPERSGLAYVVVVHLSPDYESHLADLLQPYAGIPVQQVTGLVRIEPDHAYIIPPNANLAAVDTHLRLTPLEPRAGRAPVDHFFRTLASTHDGSTVGVILTGTGSDGTLGIKAIKERNGFAVVQDPDEAEFDGMPRSAISTGLVDRVLPLAEIPDAVIRFARTEPRVTSPVDGSEDGPEQQLLLQKVFAQVRARTGRDFSLYKRSTLLRRIQRRMQIRHVEDLGVYGELLRQEAAEARALADDILITVTNFFRDPEVWQHLAAEVVPKLFEGKGPNDVVRVWSIGCATGEEAYSLAMLLLEEAARREGAPRVQVFASDLHEHSLERAREGFYPGDIKVDVSPERLGRFFHAEDGGYRVRKEVREQVLFAPHNLLSDPPFSRLDLISCRNVMIYLQRDAQHDLLQLFHYALNPEGILVLGASETVAGPELFGTASKAHRIYRKRSVRGAEPRLPVFLTTRARQSVEPRPSDTARTQVSFGALHQTMVEQYAPPSMLVGPDGRVVHLSEHAGRYLLLPGGEPTTSAYKLVREELQIELQAALRVAREKGVATRSRAIPVRFDGEWGTVVLDVRAARSAEQEGFALVIFDERPETEPAPASAGGEDDARIGALKAELEMARQRLQAVIEEYEATQEEMRASNEELQSVNEELRSALEELQTLNQENRNRVEELSQLSSDLQNLLTATEIATLFLDRDLRILRFTRKVGELFNIRPVDRGRPLSDLTHRLGRMDLSADAERVLRTLVKVEQEVEDQQGRWYLTRLLPYRSTADRVEGVVITFVDITQRRRAEEEVAQAKVFAESIVATLHEPLLILHPDLRVRTANRAFYEHFAVSREETEGRLLYELGNGEWDIPALRTLLENVLPEDYAFNDYQVTHRLGNQGERVMLLNARRLPHVQLILLGIRDITEKTRFDEAQRESEARQEFLLHLSDTIRSLHSTAEIKYEATRALSERLGADRAFYGTISEDGRTCLVEHGFHAPGVFVVEGRYSIGDFGQPLVQEMVAGYTVVIADVAAVPLADEERAAYAAIDVRAGVAVPLVKDGRWVAFLAVHQQTPRDWTQEEVALVREVAERTWAAVERAQAEAALRESEATYRTLFNSMDEGFCIVQLMLDEQERPIDYRFIEVNPAFERQSGMRNAVGRTIRELVPDIEPFWVDIFGAVALTGEPTHFVNHAKPLARWFDVYAFRIGERSERQVAVLFNDITERKRAEEQIRRQLEEKTALLSEVHHRVKNNLQIISSLLNMQIRALKDPVVVEALRQSQNRTRAIALVHETLYRSGSYAQIDLADYLSQLAQQIQRAGAGRGIQFTLDMERCAVPLKQAVPCGLLLNELITNALKHAFPEEGKGEVRITLSCDPDQRCTLSVHDSGVGIPEDLDLENTRSVGMQLVHMLSHQLRAQLEIRRGPGTQFRVSFPLRQDVE